MSDNIINYDAIVTITNASVLAVITNNNIIETITNEGAPGIDITKIEIGLWDVGKWQLGDANFYISTISGADEKITVYDTIVTITNVVE